MQVCEFFCIIENKYMNIIPICDVLDTLFVDFDCIEYAFRALWIVDRAYLPAWGVSLDCFWYMPSDA